MCVSAQFCEAHLLLLFKILETSRDPVVRSNIVIALGDIAVCFGSLIDDVSHLLAKVIEAELRILRDCIKVLPILTRPSRRTRLWS